MNVKQRRSFLHTWHYVGYLMGVPEALLTSNQKEVDELYKVALMCEPPPSNESIVMANALINSSAKISKLGDQEGKQLIHNVYKVSRALVGDKLADQLHYPPTKKFGVFLQFRIIEKFKNLMAKIFKSRSVHGLELMTKFSLYEKKGGISYMLPDNASAELTHKW